MFKKRILSIIMILVMVFSMMGFTVSAAAEVTCSKTEQYELIAGQNYIEDAGTALVGRCGNMLNIGIYPNKGWELVEWHIEVVASPEDFPQNHGGLIPGKFRFSSEKNFGSEPYECHINLVDSKINLTSAFYLAIHAVVQRYNSETCSWQQETAWAFTCCKNGGFYDDGANWATFVAFPNTPATCQ